LAIIDMRKVSFIGLKKDKEAILSAFQEAGCLEVVPVELPGDGAEEDTGTLIRGGNQETIELLEREIAELNFALKYLSQKSADGSREGRRLKVTQKQLADVRARKHEILQVAEKCRQFDNEENEIDNRRGRLKASMEKFFPWMGMNVQVEEISDTPSVLVRAVSVSRDHSQGFYDEVTGLEACVVKHSGENAEISTYFVVCHRKMSESLMEMIRKYDATFENFSGYSGTPESIVKNMEQKVEDLYRQQDMLQKRAGEMTGSVPDIRILLDLLSIDLQRDRASSRLMNSGKAFALKGWVRVDDQELLEKTVQEVTQVYALEFEKPADDEPFPVYTRNAGVVTPYESITNLYSVPDSRGIDPNAVVAPFHALFMGLMLGDAAYGLILALGTFLYIRFGEPEKGVRKLAGVLFGAGLFSILWGILLGSYFGDLGTKLGINALLLNPMERPVEMLGLCLGLGMIHILVGLGVKAYMYIKKGQYLDAIFDVVFWYLILIGLPLMATPYGNIGKWMALAGAVGLLLTQGREKESIAGKIMGGLGSLYGITGYLSDILSYSRLFALMLSGAVVSMVFNQLAAMVGVNVVGYLAAVLVFAVGHVFNLFISGLGAFVHGSRLVYVEFFGKFFVGGGHAFDPLKKETKFVKLNDKEAL